MAATITIDTNDGRYVQGNRFIRKGSGNLGSYATNGVPITAAMFELPGTISDVDIRPAGGFVFEWDKTNSKVKAFDQKDPAAAGGADVALPEVGNAVSLTAAVFRFRVEGF